MQKKSSIKMLTPLIFSKIKQEISSYDVMIINLVDFEFLCGFIDFLNGLRNKSVNNFV